MHGFLDVINRLLTPQRARRYPVALLAVTAGAYALQLSRAQDCVEPGGKLVGRDFLAFFMAGEFAARGDYAELYRLDRQSAYQTAFMRSRNPEWAETCIYFNPPHYAWAMSWLWPLGYGWALAVWWAWSATLFVATLALVASWLDVKRLNAVALLAVCFPPWFLAMAGGQNTFASLFGMTAFCTLLMRSRPLAAGLALSLLSFKFQFLVVPALWLLMTRQWRALTGVALGGAATLALTVAACGISAVEAYVSFLAGLGEVMTREGFDAYKQHSWYGFWYILGHGWLPLASIQILSLTCAAATMVVAFSLAGSPSGQAANGPRALAAMTLAQIATCPHLFHYDMLLCVLPAALWVRWQAQMVDAGLPQSAAGNDAPGMGDAPGRGPRGTTFLDPERAALLTRAVRLLVAAAFLWMACAAPVALYLRVQLSPWILLAAIVCLRAPERLLRWLRNDRQAAAASLAPGA